MNKKMLLTLALPVLLASSAMQAGDAGGGGCPKTAPLAAALAKVTGGKSFIENHNPGALAMALHNGVKEVIVITVLHKLGVTKLVTNTINQVFRLPVLRQVSAGIHRLADAIAPSDEVQAQASSSH